MTTTDADSSWLPDLIEFSAYDGDWNAYVEAVYAIFHRDFIASKPRFPGKRVGLKRHPDPDGKTATFWHMVSEGKAEDERLPVLARCERIAWPRPMIDLLAALRNGDQRICCWRQDRGRAKRIAIALPDFSYLVILDDRGDFVLPWTAYPIDHHHQRAKLERECKRWRAHQKAGAAPWEDGSVTPATPGS